MILYDINATDINRVLLLFVLNCNRQNVTQASVTLLFWIPNKGKSSVVYDSFSEFSSLIDFVWFVNLFHSFRVFLLLFRDVGEGNN